jgi:hypothetical protein
MKILGRYFELSERKRFRTFAVMRDTESSTRIDAGHVIEPAEKTAPPLRVE